MPLFPVDPKREHHVARHASVKSVAGIHVQAFLPRSPGQVRPSRRRSPSLRPRCRSHAPFLPPTEWFRLWSSKRAAVRPDRPRKPRRESPSPPRIAPGCNLSAHHKRRLESARPVRRWPRFIANIPPPTSWIVFSVPPKMVLLPASEAGLRRRPISDKATYTFCTVRRRSPFHSARRAAFARRASPQHFALLIRIHRVHHARLLTGDQSALAVGEIHQHRRRAEIHIRPLRLRTIAAARSAARRRR